jgi:hypothetical protein
MSAMSALVMSDNTIPHPEEFCQIISFCCMPSIMPEFYVLVWCMRGCACFEIDVIQGCGEVDWFKQNKSKKVEL